MTEGHLPPVSQGVKLVGKAEVTNPSGAGNDGRVADVSASGKFAFLTAFRDPTCERGGAHVIDMSDPKNPFEVTSAFMDTTQFSYAGEGSLTHRIKNQFFDGVIFVHQNETCPGAPPPTAPATRGGINIWDVSDPRNPELLVKHAGDFTNPAGGVDPQPNDTHNVFVWTNQFDGRTYAVLVDNEEFTDLDIMDITDPRNPVLVNDTLDLFLPPFNVGQDSPPNLTSIFSHDMIVKRVGKRYVMNAGYWDGGYVLLDVTDPTPGNVTLIAESDYAELDEERLARGHEISPEGNAHQSELSPDNRFLVGTDEDFNAYRVVAEITSGPNSGTEFTAISGSGVPPIDADTNISGTPTFVGLACPTSPPPAGDGIALIERGVCSFQEKLDTVKAAGYDAGIVFNTVRPDCQGLVFMLAAGDIPFVFVTRATGLQLLNQTLSADVCTQASPAVGSPVASAAGRRGPRRPRRPRVGRVGPLGAARARARARAGRAGLGVAAAWTPRRAAVRTRRGTWAPNAWRVAPPATTAIHRSSRCRWPRRPPRRLPGTSAVSRRLSVSRARLSGLEIRRAPLLRLPATTLRFRRVDMQNVRDLPDLWPYRQRRHLVVACLDDVRSLEALRSQIEGLGGILIVEREPGPLSGRLGRPSVTVADRFGTVGLTAKEIPPERILAELEAFELSCPECGPQAWGDPGA